MLRNGARETEFDPPDRSRFIGIVFPPFAGGLKKLGLSSRFALSFYISQRVKLLIQCLGCKIYFSRFFDFANKI